jgi:hypothetical protein
MRPTLRLVFVLSWFSVALFAGQSMNSSQLVDFVRSSLALKYDDGRIAKELKAITLTDKLDQKTVESLEAQGAGPKTIKALEELCDQTVNIKSSGSAKDLSSSMTPEFKQPPPPGSAAQKKILDAMRNYASNYTQSLPNYICVQVTSRYKSFDGGENYQFEDKIAAKLSYNDGQEKYKVYLVNGRMADTDMQKLGGARSSGEFGSLMKSIFAEKSQTQFDWEKWARLGSNVVVVFNYSVDNSHSDFMLDYDNGAQRTITAYKGLIYADQNTGIIRRITFEAVDVPAGFPIRESNWILNYGDQKIGDNTYVLPLSASVTMLGPQNVHTKNDESFKLYQKFSTDALIHFSQEELQPDAGPADDPVMRGLPPPPPK